MASTVAELDGRAPDAKGLLERMNRSERGGIKMLDAALDRLFTGPHLCHISKTRSFSLQPFISHDDN